MKVVVLLSGYRLSGGLEIHGSVFK